jgi:hypothetical protein
VSSRLAPDHNAGEPVSVGLLGCPIQQTAQLVRFHVGHTAGEHRPIVVHHHGDLLILAKIDR